jgi:hypothetical protein
MVNFHRQSLSQNIRSHNNSSDEDEDDFQKKPSPKKPQTPRISLSQSIVFSASQTGNFCFFIFFLTQIAVPIDENIAWNADEKNVCYS